MEKVPFLLVLIMMTASLAGCLGDDDGSNDDSNYTSETTERTYSWLFTQTAANATSNNGTLTIETQQHVFAFTDRPDRIFAHAPVENFTMLWSHNNSTFGEDPPNAVLNWMSENGSMNYAEIILTDAKVNENGFIEYDYIHETGYTIPSNLSETSLFIDDWVSDLTGFLDCISTARC